MKRNTLKTGIILGIITSLFTITTNAQSSDKNQQKPQRPTIEELLKEMDANKDGKLSLKEVKGPLKDDFKKIDANEDGFLTKEELEKAPKPSKKPKKE